MTQRFWKYFWRVAGVHAVLLVLIIVVPAVLRFISRKREPLVVPIEFTVEVPSEPAPPVPDPPPVVPKPDPDPTPPPEPKPKPKPKPRPPIERSTNMVTRSTGAPQPKPTPALTAKQSQELLAAGAKPSDRTSIPGEDARCMDMIRRRLYAAWTQPTGYAGDVRTAEVALTLRKGGSVAAWSLVRPSC